jgi:type I restriction enzyme R subunit
VTSDEGAIGKGHLSDFQDLDAISPVILTTSKLLTTGVDAPTIKNVVIARAINSMTEFKQIIGRGTRVRDDYGKLWFNIIDYTGSATRLFADHDFDGEPVISTEIEIDNDGTETSSLVISEDSHINADSVHQVVGIIEAQEDELVKYYFDGGQVSIVANLVYELDAEGNQLRVIQYSRYVGETIKSLFPTPPELANAWADPEQRAKVTLLLQERGIGFKELADEAGMPEADPFDLICHIVFNAPLRTRRERAASLKENHKDFFTKYGKTAKEVLEALVEKYASYGEEEFKLPETLKVQPISDLGNPNEIADAFGGAESLRDAVLELQELLYSDRIHSER